MSAIDLWCDSLLPEELGHVQHVFQLLSDLRPHLSGHQITSGHNFILNSDYFLWVVHLRLHI